MGTLNKFIRASIADNCDWKTELPNFLMHYRPTPHCATHVSPFEALTGRKMNIGLPDIPRTKPNTVPTSMAKNDAVSKAKMKEYADEKRHTSPSSLTPGSHVLMKQRKINKLTPPYNPEPYTVVQKHGSMVTAERNGHFLTRNSSYFRPVKVTAVPEEDEEHELDRPNNDETPLSNDLSSGPMPVSGQAQSDSSVLPYVPESHLPVNTPSQSSSPKAPRRNPQRSAGMPQKYKDYVLN